MTDHLPQSQKYVMKSLPVLCFIVCMLFISCFATLAQAFDRHRVEIVAIDPDAKTTLGRDEQLYVNVRYEADTPLRFQAIGMFDGVPLEVGAIKNPPALHAPGTGEALAWVIYTNPTHIDAVQITVFNQQWKKMSQFVHDVDIAWQDAPAKETRNRADWVAALIRSERRQMDYVYDPTPQKYGILYDLFFFLNVASIPAYILLQLHMLWRYRYRWRELAVIPIFPYFIVGFYIAAGLNVETALLVTFLFRYTPCALMWLIVLWLAKRFWQHKLPPPKLYKPPKT